MNEHDGPNDPFKLQAGYVALPHSGGSSANNEAFIEEFILRPREAPLLGKD